MLAVINGPRPCKSYPLPAKLVDSKGNANENDQKSRTKNIYNDISNAFNLIEARVAVVALLIDPSNL